jgi:hypothetical protein
MKSKIFKVVALLLLFLGTATLTIAAQTAPQSAVPAYLEGNQAKLDWSTYTLGSMPPLPNGQTIASTLTLGDVPAAGELSWLSWTLGDNCV